MISESETKAIRSQISEAKTEIESIGTELNILLVVIRLMFIIKNIENKSEIKRIRKEAIIPTVEHDSNRPPSSRQCPTDCQRYPIREQEKSAKFGY